MLHPWPSDWLNKAYAICILAWYTDNFPKVSNPIGLFPKGIISHIYYIPDFGFGILSVWEKIIWEKIHLGKYPTAPRISKAFPNIKSIVSNLVSENVGLSAHVGLCVNQRLGHVAGQFTEYKTKKIKAADPV